MNSIFYEFRPVALLALGVYAAMGKENPPLMVASGYLLIAATSMILWIRLKNRGII